MSVQQVILSHLRNDELPDPGIKNVTVRLSFTAYAELSVLSQHLGVSVSGLLKQLSEAAISEGLGVYMDSYSDPGEIGSEIHDILCDLQSEV